MYLVAVVGAVDDGVQREAGRSKTATTMRETEKKKEKRNNRGETTENLLGKGENIAARFSRLLSCWLFFF